MKRRGSILFEVIIGLFFLGILVVFIFPMLGFSFNNIRNIRHKDEMNYIGEMVVEKLKSGSGLAIETINDLDYFGEVVYEDEDFNSSLYSCKLVKLYSSQGFIEYFVIVELKDDKSVQPVQYKSSSKR